MGIRVLVLFRVICVVRLVRVLRTHPSLLLLSSSPREKERASERERQRDRERQRESETARERERDLRHVACLCRQGAHRCFMPPALYITYKSPIYLTTYINQVHGFAARPPKRPPLSPSSSSSTSTNPTCSSTSLSPELGLGLGLGLLGSPWWIRLTTGGPSRLSP